MGAVALAGCDRLPTVPPPILAAPTPTPSSRPVFHTVAPEVELSPPVQLVPDPRPVPPPAAMPSVRTLAEPSAPILVALPPPRDDILTPAGRELIYEFETGGRSGYNPHPEWPKGASGVTIGIGYDLAYNTREAIREDWRALPPAALSRLIDSQGLTGAAAQRRALELHDITIPWQAACDVFEKVTVSRFDRLCARTWPRYREFRPHAGNGLLSLTFNRGSSMVGPTRRHMRAIRDLCPALDYTGIAAQERASTVVWEGTAIYKGMKRRRYAEAALIEKP